MPSFTRRVPSTAPPPLPTLIKTGVPSLDDLFHLPPSSSTLIFSPDQHSSWPRLISRYFIAQAFLASEEVVVVAEEASGRELVKGCMWVDERGLGSGKAEESGSEGEVDGGGEGDNRTKIAWRYNGMDKFKTSIGRSLPSPYLSHGNHMVFRHVADSRLIGEKGQLNLSTSVPKPLLDQAEKGKHLQYLDINADADVDGQPSGSTSSRSWSKLSSVLTRLQTLLAKLDGKTTTRVIIHELGGADYDDPPLHVLIAVP